MKTMLISILALTGFAFAESAPSNAAQVALQTARVVQQASAPDCCQPQADCCQPGADCCQEKTDAKADAKAADCCAPGAACCVPGAACCD